MNFLSL